MSEGSFVSSYQKYHALALVSIQDWADRLSFSYSTVLLCFCTLVVTTKTYILKPLACHIPTTPGGSKFPDYLESYCWVQGTVPLRMNESIPEHDDEWSNLIASRQINYYQWVPFVLGLQTIMFYLPYLAWQNITFNRLGIDLTSIIMKALNALKTTSPTDREAQITDIASRLELLLFAHRDYRHGKLSEVKRKLNNCFSFLFASKRLGTWIVFSYMCIKLLYLANAILQLYIMQQFLGYSESMMSFGIYLTRSLILGGDWRESLYFPRVSFCSVEVRHLGQNDNRYLAMCALAINMLNEKLYIFLWFWTMFVCICTVFSIFIWISRLTFTRNQSKCIRKYLKLSDYTPDMEKWHGEHIDSEDKKMTNRFIKEFLRLDGVFIVNMLYLNSGDIVTGEVVRLLWKAWISKYSESHNFKCDPWKNYINPTNHQDSDVNSELEKKVLE